MDPARGTEAVASLVESQNTQFNQSTRLIQDTSRSFGKRRPPVQPDSEVAKEQRAIQRIVQKNALFIQIVLFLVLLCAVAYLILPQGTANIAALLILGVAVIYRIFFVQ